MGSAGRPPTIWILKTSENVQLVDYLRAVRRRWRLVLLLTLAVAGTALIVSLSLQKQYDATVEMLLREPEQVNQLLDPGGSSGSGDPERDLNTNVQLIENESTAQTVRDRLGLARSTKALLLQVDTKTSSTSNIVDLTVRDPDPKLSAAIANAFAQAYVEYRVNSARLRYTQAAALAARQLQALSPPDRLTAEARQLQSRQRELEIAAALQTGGAEVVRRASVPTGAARPRPKLSIALGVVIGLLFGVATALVLELFDRRFKDESAVEGFFELPILAAIPRPRRRGAGLDLGAQSEAYGLLAANLRLAGRQSGSTVLMVTSPSPGDGKTSVTLGIARACARLGLNVIAIEADLRRPTFGQFTDVTLSQGLTGVLSGTMDLEHELLWLDANTLQPSLNDGDQEDGELGLLPAGQLPINPQRVLSQAAMRALVEQARTLADIVLVDTAPAGTVNDPLTMARLVDGVVIVARLNKTTKEAARRALRVLGNAEVELTGVVVTDAAESERYGYYQATSTPEPRSNGAPGSPVGITPKSSE